MANRLQYARDFNPYSKDVSMDELKKVRRQLAKVMNQRMVRLEQAGSSVSGKAYTYGSYEQMQDYLGTKGRRRFSEVLDPQMSKRALQKEIRVLQGFEQQKSSRVAGQKEIERKRIHTLVEDLGLSENTASSKEFYDFLNSETYEKLSRSFNSEDIIEEYERASEVGVSAKKIAEALKDYQQKSRRMSLKGMRKALSAKTVKGKKKKRK